MKRFQRRIAAPLYCCVLALCTVAMGDPETPELQTQPAPLAPRTPASKTPLNGKSLTELLHSMPNFTRQRVVQPPAQVRPKETPARPPARDLSTPLLSTHRLEEFLEAGNPDAVLRALREAATPSQAAPSPAVPAAPTGRPVGAPPHPPLPPEPEGVRDPLPAIYRGQTRDADCPNVVVIMIDTLRSDRLSCYGEEQPTSPALDRLAEQGVRFENVLSQCTWTRPSIGSMMTSRYPRELGLYVEQEQILAPEFKTWPEVMKDTGYRTIGLTANPNINTSFNFHQGYDMYVDSDVLFFWMPVQAGQTVRGVTALPGAPDLFEKALALVNETGNEGPYFLYFNLMEAHEWASDRPGTSMLRREYMNLFQPGDDYTRYVQLIRQVTDDIGVFVDRLTELPGWEDTIFVFVSDHGEGLNDHPNVGLSMNHGFTVYESVSRVPWIIYRKGWEPKQHVITQEVRLLDVMPTVMDMIGGAAPPGAQGVSLRPVIEGESKLAVLPRYEVIETQFQGTDKVAVYGKRFKYIENRVPQEGMPSRELQPRGGHENGSATSVIAKYPEVTAALKDYLEGWESRIPRRPPTAPIRKITQQQLDQLESIGYLAN